MIRLAAFAAACVLSPAVWALDFPIVAVEGACHKWGAAAAEAKCIEQEQASYDIARLLWRGITGKRQAECLDIAETARISGRYYLALSRCLSSARERDQAESPQVPRFRY